MPRTLLTLLAFSLGAAFPSADALSQANDTGPSSMRIHYVEIVTRQVEAQCEALAKLHDLSFGPEQADMGNARIAEAGDGRLIGVRAPLAEHDLPIVRNYFEVTDIEQALKEAEALGAMVAYPPTQQGDFGTWAIYILGDAQIGLWQR